MTSKDRAELARQLDRDHENVDAFIWSPEYDRYCETHASNGMLLPNHPEYQARTFDTDGTVHHCEACGCMTGNAHGFCERCLEDEERTA